MARDLFKIAHRAGIAVGISLVAAAVFSLLSTPLQSLMTLPGGVLILFVEFLAPCCWKSGKNLAADERTTMQKFILFSRGRWARFMLHAFVCIMGFVTMYLITHSTSWWIYLTLILTGVVSLVYLGSAIQTAGKNDGAVGQEESSDGPYQNISSSSLNQRGGVDPIVSYGTKKAVDYAIKNPDVAIKVASAAAGAYEPPSAPAENNPWAAHESLY